MAVPPETAEEWCYLVPNLFSTEGWQILHRNPSSTFFRCRSPWGGSLVKLVLEDVFICDPPEDPAALLLRPETRAFSAADSKGESTHEVCVELCRRAPGDCMLQWHADWKLSQLMDVLFGEMGRQFSTVPCGRAMLRRNFPEQGHCFFTVASDTHQRLLHSEPDLKEGFFTVTLVAAVRPSIQPTWAGELLRLTLDVFRETTNWYLNRPGMSLYRQIDHCLYVVLNITSYKKAPCLPVLASDDTKDVIKIDAGQELGLTSWASYPMRVGGRWHFRLTEYLQLLLERIGERAAIYDSLDGQKLVPFQCALLRAEWQRLRPHFIKVMLLQMTAYRRAHGGTSAPRVAEAPKPRFCQEPSVERLKETAAVAQGHLPIVVRNTFLEVDVDDASDGSKSNESCAHAKSLSPRHLASPVLVF